MAGEGHRAHVHIADHSQRFSRCQQHTRRDPPDASRERHVADGGTETSGTEAAKPPYTIGERRIAIMERRIAVLEQRGYDAQGSLF